MEDSGSAMADLRVPRALRIGPEHDDRARSRPLGPQGATDLAVALVETVTVIHRVEDPTM